MTDMFNDPNDLFSVLDGNAERPEAAKEPPPKPKKQSSDSNWDKLFEPVAIDVATMKRGNKCYAGSGDQDIPENLKETLIKIATRLEDLGLTLRSGDDDRNGVEKALRAGATTIETYLPWPNFNKGKIQKPYVPKPTATAYGISTKYHAAFNKVKPVVRSLIARTTQMVIGPDDMTPIDFLICYTQDGAETLKEISRNTGIASHMIRICNEAEIPVFNLAKESSYDRLASFITNYSQG